MKNEELTRSREGRKMKKELTRRRGAAERKDKK